MKDSKNASPQADPVAIVGIGASAGGLAALQSLFSALGERRTGMAFVVVVHLSPDHLSKLAEILQLHTSMPVAQVTARIRMERDHVYVISPNRSLEVNDSYLAISEFATFLEKRKPIDHFFRSLAAAELDSVGIILSGAGSDGAVGIKTIKERGGILIAQSPEEAEHDSMPRNAIATNLVDFVLPTCEIADRLADYYGTKRRITLPSQVEELDDRDSSTIQKILTRLRSQTGHDFGQYKRSTTLRRIEQRMQINHLTTLTDYLEYLRSSETETHALLRSLLISVTNFFRDPESWAALGQKAIPQILNGKDPQDRLRAWVVGCATGEEAYSLAMLLLETADSLNSAPQIQVFATDIDEAALEFARIGRYPEAIEADLSDDRLKRFFRKEKGFHRIREELSEYVLFSRHNLLSDPPFSKLDLISCRNVLIYFNRSLQNSAFEIFQYALNPDGVLFLGPSEGVEGTQELFKPIDKQFRILKAEKKGKRQRVPILPLEKSREFPETGESEPASDANAFLAQCHHQALEEHAPPSVLVDHHFELIHLSPRAGRFLIHPGGTPTKQLVKLIREELRVELETALFQAFKHRAATSSPPIRVRFNAQERFVYLVVQPVFESEPPGTALVSFLEVAEVGSGNTSRSETPRERQLQQELQRVREQLQTTIEEFESSREEMKASNEELQAVNEEHRSALEELETSQEELQSVNEELQAVNQELKNKVDELSQANSNLQNLMTSAEIATLFLDRNLRVQLYTPKLEELVSILPDDLGQSVDRLTHRIEARDLVNDMQQALRTLEIIEHEVQTSDGKWFLVRTRPYRTVEDKIDGVVVTFVDITERKRSAEELEALNRDLEEQVRKRTAQLEKMNRELTLEVTRRKELQKKSVEVRVRQQRSLGEQIHDGLAQQVSGVRMLAKSFLKQSKKNQKIRSEDVEEVLRHLEFAESEIQTLVRGLVPITFDEDAGLVVALERMVERLSELWPKVDYRVESDGTVVIDDDLAALKLYHIAQEAVQNASKHGRPTRIVVRIRAGRNGEIILEIEDNGIGFNEENIRNNKGVGIELMKHRAEIIDARLEITPRKRGGTLVRCFYRPGKT